MRIAVVIVNYNAGPHLARTLEALAAQQRPADRIVVVDNASHDGSLAACAAWPAVEVLASSTNDGFAAANNRAVAHVDDCDWVALLNPDAFPDADWLAALEAAAGRHPEVPLFASQQRLADDPTRLDGVGDVYHVSGLAWRGYHLAPTATGPQQDTDVFSACAAAAFCRRDVFLALGGFDERFFAYMEDVDFGFRVRLAGYRCLYVPAARVLHVGSGTSSVGSDFAVYHGHRNLVWTFAKNMPGWWGLRYLPQHLLLTAVTAVHFVARGQGRVFWRAKRDALRGLRGVLASRRRTPTTRVASRREVGRVMAHGWITPYRAHLSRARSADFGVP